MSSQRGNVKRTRPQKHKNSTAFKNNMHDCTPKVRMINALEVTGCCARCKDIIDWKIKYKKYKPLSQPKTCTMCKQKTVKKAYYLLCDPCATARGVCAKCGDKQETPKQSEPTGAEKEDKEAVFIKQLKSLSEKQRRKFMRLMSAGRLQFGQDLSAIDVTGQLDAASDHESDEEEEESTEATEPQGATAVLSVETPLQPDIVMGNTLPPVSELVTPMPSTSQ